jgi:hypothetical protein
MAEMADSPKANKPAPAPSNRPWEWHIQETYKGLITLSVELLKISALVNGGAVIAILTFCGNLASKGQSSLLGNFKPAILWYCAGLGATMITFNLACWTQLRLYKEERNRHEGKAFKEVHPWFIGVGICLSLFAIIAFAIGCGTAADVIQLPKPPGPLRDCRKISVSIFLQNVYSEAND